MHHDVRDDLGHLAEAIDEVLGAVEVGEGAVEGGVGGEARAEGFEVLRFPGGDLGFGEGVGVVGHFVCSFGSAIEEEALTICGGGRTVAAASRL